MLDKEQKQDNILFALNNQIVRIRNKEDMLFLLRNSLKQFIFFDDSFILRYNKNNRICRPYIFHAEKGRSANAEFENNVNIGYPIDDDSITDLETPVVQDVELLFRGGNKNVAFIHRAGIKEYVVLKLVEGNELIGLFVLLSENKNTFNGEVIELLKKLSYPISIATANIIANEDIVNREEEKNMLISMSNEIAALKSREDLFDVVNGKIKKMFSVREFGFSKIDEGGKTFSALVMDVSEERRSNPAYDKTIATRFDVTDPLFTEVMNAEDPIIYDVQELAKKPGMPAYVDFWQNAGIERVLIAALRVGGTGIGTAIFILEKNAEISSKNTLLKGVCSQLAVAVSNILANEKIKGREEEKTVLLSLSNEIALLNNREDLFEVVNTRIKKLLGVEEFGIAQIDEAGDTYSAFMLEFLEETKSIRTFSVLTSARYSVNDPLFTMIMNNDDPTLLDVKELVRKPGMPEYIKLWKKAGFKYYLAVPLRVGRVNIGFVNFHFTKPDTIGAKKNLIKGICAQLAVAVSNILANERIHARDEEKNLLLSLSNEIAALKSREDLFRVVNSKIKQLFSIKQLGFTKIDDNRTTYSIFLVDVKEMVRRHPGFEKIFTAKFDVQDPLFAEVMASEKPILYDVHKLVKRPGMPPYVAFWNQVGIDKVATLALRVGGVDIGTALFIIDKDTEFNTQSTLLTGVCSQLAVTVSNILANEKIQERELEKTRLLEFSNLMASVRDKDVIAKILRQQLKDFFGIEDYVIHALSKNKKTHRPVLFDPQANFVQHPDFQKLLHADTDVNDGVFNKILAAAEVVYFNAEDWLSSDAPPSYTNAAKAVDLKKMSGISIRLGQENIAVMNFRMDEKSNHAIQSPLFKSICSQIAIAISNIIANDEILGKEEEKSMLLEFSNAIASVRDKQTFARILKQQLNKLFSIEDYVINILSEDGKSVNRFLFDEENEIFKTPEFLKILTTPINVNDGILNKILDTDGPVTFKVEEWAVMKKPPVYFAAAAATGMKYLTGVRIRLGNKNIAFLSIKHDELGIPVSRVQFLKSICSQIAIAVSNIMANEKIHQQLIEIEKYKQQLEEEKIYLKEEIETSHNYSEIIGESTEVKKVFHMVTQVAPSDSTVLLLGETGTGKELIARAIHNSSPRKNKLMIKINCAALPANLIESELFGHERGSFTGAVDRRIGKFELANNGTLFLDEIGEMPLELQVKLLRALQEKEIERIGGKTTIKTDVRIVAATNRNLEKLMEEGKFRSDLYYRLNVFPIQLPPLRARREDIEKLASHFIMRFSKKSGKKISTLSNKVLQELKNYDWPGNIRELEHMIERSVILATGDTIKDIHLPNQKGKISGNGEPDILKIQTIFENEKEYILKILQHVNGRIAGEGGAADILGVPPSTLNSRIKKLGIRKEHRG